MRATTSRLVPSESQEQQALMQWAKLSEKKHPELRLLLAVPNGGARHIATARRMKTEGVRKGAPDLCLPVARGGFHALFIELKRLRGGRVSPEQKQWLNALNEQGHLAVVCHGWEAARVVIERYLVGGKNV